MTFQRVKLDARNVSKHFKGLRQKFTPTVAIARAVLPFTNDLATQFALPTKDKLIRTAYVRLGRQN